MSWADFQGKDYDRQGFLRRVESLTWKPKVWDPAKPKMPSGIVLHNTAAPTLAQWAEDGPKHDARIRNLKNYYQNDQQWSGGPHLFISRNHITEFDGLLERGTHSPSFNATHFGIEMVGDYSREEFNTGDGAKVRDNAVFAVAVLCMKFGWDPKKVIKFHKEDPRTTHDCPGKKVVKADVVRRVVDQIRILRGKPPLVSEDKPLPFVDEEGDHPFPVVSTPVPVKRKLQTNITATVFGGEGDENESAYGGMVDPDVPGVALPWRFKGTRPRVKVYHGNKSVICDIVDRGPWNLNDDYWERGERPRVEQQLADGEEAENGRVPTNDAAIDLTPGGAKVIDLDGKGKVNWEFTTAPVLAVPRRGSMLSPAVGNVKEQTAVYSIETEVVQRQLKGLGYHQVGTIDGKIGGSTRGAVTAFKIDRHLESESSDIDDELKNELSLAEQEGWTKPIAPERANITEEEAEKKAPEITPVKQSRLVALWGGVAAAFGTFTTWVAENFRETMTWLGEVKDYFNIIPGWIWFAALAGALFYFYKNSSKSADGIVKSVQTGERN